MLFEKSGQFFQSEHRDRLDPFPPLPLFVYIRSLRPPFPFYNKHFIKKVLSEEMEGVNDNASAFMHLNNKANIKWQKITF